MVDIPQSFGWFLEGVWCPPVFVRGTEGWSLSQTPSVVTMVAFREQRFTGLMGPHGVKGVQRNWCKLVLRNGQMNISKNQNNWHLGRSWMFLALKFCNSNDRILPQIGRPGPGSRCCWNPPAKRSLGDATRFWSRCPSRKSEEMGTHHCFTFEDWRVVGVLKKIEDWPGGCCSWDACRSFTLLGLPRWREKRSWGLKDLSYERTNKNWDWNNIYETSHVVL